MPAAQAALDALQVQPELAEISRAPERAGPAPLRRLYEGRRSKAGVDAVIVGAAGLGAGALLPSVAAERVPGTRVPAPAAFWGAALVATVSPVWSHALIPLLAATALAGLFLLDVLSGGALSRRLVRRARALDPARDLPALLAGPDGAPARDGDVAQVRGFLEMWRATAPTGRAELAAKAVRGGALWREKLLAAYWLESRGLASDRGVLLEALASGNPLEPAEPLVRRQLERRGRWPWMGGEAAAELEARFLGVSARPPRRRAARAAAWTAVASLALLSSLAGWRSHELGAEREAARLSAQRILYDRYQFVFDDEYRDPRIKREVLPVLRDWSREDSRRDAALERAIDILRSSADPKSDNVLEALLHTLEYQAGSGRTEEALARVLIERDSDAGWAYLERRWVADTDGARPTPAQRARLLRLLDLLGEVGGASPRQLDRALAFTDSPDPGIAARASAVAEKLLTQRGDFLDRVGWAYERYAAQPPKQVWLGRLLLRELSDGGRDAYFRGRFFAVEHFLQQTYVALGEGPTGPSSPWDRKVGPGPAGTALLEDAARRAQAAGKSLPPALAYAIRHAVYDRTWLVLGEVLTESRGEAIEDLGKSGVFPADRLDRWRVWLGAYKLNQIAAVRAVAAGLPKAATRAPLLERLEALGRTSGIPAGGLPQDLAADEANAVLAELFSDHSYGSSFIPMAELLREAGLAPPLVMSQDSKRSFHPVYTAEELGRIGLLLEDFLGGGRGWDKNRERVPLDAWSGRPAVLAAIDKLAAVQAARFPGAAWPALPDAAVKGPVEALGAALAAKDEAKAKEAEAALASTLKGARAKEAFRARLEGALKRHWGEARAQLGPRLFPFMLASAMGPDGRGWDRDGLAEMLREASGATWSPDGWPAEAAVWGELDRALGAVKGGQPVHPGVADFAAGLIDSRASREAEAGLALATRLDPAARVALGADWAEGGALTGRWGHLRTQGYTLFRLGRLRAGLEKVAAASTGAVLDEKEKAFLARWPGALAQAEAAARLAGLPEGASPGWQAAERLWEAVADYNFPSQVHRKGWLHAELRQAGMLPSALRDRAWGREAWRHYPAVLDRTQLLGLRALFQSLLVDDLRRPIPQQSIGQMAIVPEDPFRREPLTRLLELSDELLAGHFPGPGAHGSAATLLKLASRPETREAGERGLDELWAASPLQEVFFLRFKSAQWGSREGAVQEAALRWLTRRLSGPGSEKIEGRDGVNLWGNAAREAGPRAWMAARESLAARPARELAATPAAVAIREAIGYGTRDVLREAIQAFPDIVAPLSAKDILLAKGRSFWGEVRRDQLASHLRAVRAEILAAAGKAEVAGPLGDAQAKVRDWARDLVPEYLATGLAAGLYVPEDARSPASDAVHAALWDLRQVMSWEFSEELVRRGAFSKAEVEGDKEDYFRRPAFTKDEARRLLAALAALSASGGMHDSLYGKVQPLSPEQAGALREAIRRVGAAVDEL